MRYLAHRGGRLDAAGKGRAVAEALHQRDEDEFYEEAIDDVSGFHKTHWG